MSPIIGKRAVYTRIRRVYDEDKRAHVEIGRELFRGTIAALVTTGQHNYPAIVLLYDDGSLRSHDISDITVEGEQAVRL